MLFLDPAQAVVDSLEPLLPGACKASSAEPGRVVCMATESPAFPLAGLQDMLKRLGVALTPNLAPAPLPVPEALEALWPSEAVSR